MLKRFESYSPGTTDRRSFWRSFFASVLIHVGAVGLLVLLVWGGRSATLATGYRVSFIPKGRPDGVAHGAAAPVVTPPVETQKAAPPPAPKAAAVAAPPKEAPPTPEPRKPKEVEKPKKKKVKPSKEKKVEKKAPRKRKTEAKRPKKKRREKKKSKRRAKKTRTKESSKKQTLAMLEPPENTDKTAKRRGTVKAQRGHKSGEEKTGVEMQAGPSGILDYWESLVQRKIEIQWETPEGVLIVPDENSAVVQFSVDRKGELVGQPQVISEASDPAVGQSGVKAILEAAPFPPLPDDFKDNERQVQVTFSLVK